MLKNIKDHRKVSADDVNWENPDCLCRMALRTKSGEVSNMMCPTIGCCLGPRKSLRMSQVVIILVT